MFGASIYGPIGIVMGEVFWTFPHALIILTTALALSDARLYEAAAALARRPVARLPDGDAAGRPLRADLARPSWSSRWSITDFGVPKVIGGQYNVLATDIYKQVVGQQNFEMGAVVGVILLIPAVLVLHRRPHRAAPADGALFRPRRRLRAEAGAARRPPVPRRLLRSSPSRSWRSSASPSSPPSPPTGRTISRRAQELQFRHDGWRRLAELLEHADARRADRGVRHGDHLHRRLSASRRRRASGCARSPPSSWRCCRSRFPASCSASATSSSSTPAPIRCTSSMARWRSSCICTISHFYSVAHLTAVTALKQIDKEFETVAASLRVPVWRTFFRVTLPVSPASGASTSRSICSSMR